MQSSEISLALESWYGRHNGEELCASIRTRLQPVLDLAFGYHILQLGPLIGRSLIDESPINHRIFASQAESGQSSLRCHGDELPLESDSVDMVVAFHALEFDENPHGCLREMQRVLRPHGHLVIIGFNPNSLLGVSQRVRRWSGHRFWRHQHPVSLHRLTDWLHLLHCEMESIHHLYPIPVLGQGRLRRLISNTDEWATRHGLPGGSVYIAHAIKQIGGVRRPQRLPLRARGRLVGISVAPSPQAAPRGAGIRAAGRDSSR